MKKDSNYVGLASADSAPTNHLLLLLVFKKSDTQNIYKYILYISYNRFKYVLCRKDKHFLILFQIHDNRLVFVLYFNSIKSIG